MVYVWGAGVKGISFSQRIKRYLLNADEMEFCDNAKDKIGTNINGIPVIDWKTINKSKYMLNKTAFVIAVRDSDREKVVNQLKKIGIFENIYYVDDVGGFINKMEQFVGKPVLPYVETHISDHCNLKCKGCGHLSNIALPKFADYEKFTKDIIRLNELFSEIKEIRLMGGEPFLNPELVKFLEFAREANPNTDLRVVTNGLLITPEKDYLLKKMADLNIQMDISGYPPTMNRREEITSLLDQYRICYQFTGEIEQFMRFRNPEANMNIEVAYEKCPIKACTFLREGEMATCSFPILYSHLDTFMKGKFKIDAEDIIDIHCTKLNGWEITWKLSQAILSCRYCMTDAIEFFPWERTAESEILCEDWLVKR